MLLYNDINEGIAMSEPKKHYVDNEKFLKALVDYKLQCKDAQTKGLPEPPIPNYIGECFIKIAEHLYRKYNFVKYTYKDDMIGDAIENCLRYFRNFDETVSQNPFAYFTQITTYAFIRRTKSEKKQTYIKYKIAEQQLILQDEEYIEEAANNNFQLYDNMSELIIKYEDDLDKKKEKGGFNIKSTRVSKSNQDIVSLPFC